MLRGVNILVLLMIIIPLGVFTVMPVDAQKKPSKISNKLVVYYFHDDSRCKYCNLIEQYTIETLKSTYPLDFKNGKVVFKSISVNKYDNEHYMYDYKLYTKSVVLSKISNGKEVKYKNLDKIWTLVRNKEKFVDYIKNEIKSFKKG